MVNRARANGQHEQHNVFFIKLTKAVCHHSTKTLSQDGYVEAKVETKPGREKKKEWEQTKPNTNTLQFSAPPWRLRHGI